MPNFNTQTEAQISSDLATYGYDWLETECISEITLILYSN